MNKIILILLSIFSIIILFITVVLIYIFFVDMQWRYSYDYITFSGRLGNSPICYEKDNYSWCKDAKGSFKVMIYEKKKERR